MTQTQFLHSELIRFTSRIRAGKHLASPQPLSWIFIHERVKRVKSLHFTYEKTEHITSSNSYQKGLSSSTPQWFLKKYYTRLLTSKSLNEAWLLVREWKITLQNIGCLILTLYCIGFVSFTLQSILSYNQSFKTWNDQWMDKQSDIQGLAQIMPPFFYYKIFYYKIISI